MPTRTLVVSFFALACFASPALAFHPQGSSTHFYGLTWGRTTLGPVPHSSGSFGAVPQTFGVVPQTFGVVPQTFGVVTHTFGVAPMSFGFVQPGNGAVGAGLFPTDILSLLQNACKIVNPGGGGVSPDLTALQKELAAIRANQTAILDDLKLLKLKLGVEPKGGAQLNPAPAAPVAPAAPAAPAAYASLDDKLTDLAASRKLLDAQRAAASAPAPAGTALAGKR